MASFVEAESVVTSCEEAESAVASFVEVESAHVLTLV